MDLDRIVRPQRNSCDFKAWPIDTIVSAYTQVGAIRFDIPPFQRDYIWKRAQQRDFINSLQDNLPVGSILLFIPPELPQTRYIVDGLQRCTTLVKFSRQPFDYIDLTSLPANALANVVSHIFGTTPHDPKAADHYTLALQDKILRWLKPRPLTEILGSSGLDSLIDFAFGGQDKISSLVRPALSHLIDEIASVALLKDCMIPVIEFSGSDESLPTVFERLNREGTKLSKFDIVAAKWSTAQVIFSQPEIADGANARFANLQELGLEYVGDEHNRRKQAGEPFLLYEFILGLGRRLKLLYPRLYGTPISGTVDSVGFNLSTLAVGLRISELGDLCDQLSLRYPIKGRNATPDLSNFADILLDASDTVWGWLSDALSSDLHKFKRKPFEHTEFQIAAIVATVANLKLCGTRTTAKELFALSRLVRQRYWFEIIGRDWAGSGDSKAYKYVDERICFQAVPRAIFERRLLDWHEQDKRDRFSKASSISKVTRGLLALALTREDARGRLLDVKVIPGDVAGENPLSLGNFGLKRERGDLMLGFGAPQVGQRRFRWIADRLLATLYG